MPLKPVPMVSAFGLAAVIVPDAPSAMAVPLTVTALLVRLALPMLDNVLFDPLTVLLVSVCVSVVPTTTPAGITFCAAAPLMLPLALDRTNDEAAMPDNVLLSALMVLLVRVCVAVVPATSVSVLFAKAMVLLVSVCVAVVVTSVEDAGIVVPLSVAVLLEASVVKAPVEAVVAPTVVPLIVPPVTVTLDEVTAPLTPPVAVNKPVTPSVPPTVALPLEPSVVKEPAAAAAPPITVPSIAPPLMSTKSNIWTTFTPSTYKCALSPLGTVMPVPAVVLTVMLWPPVVLFCTMYCFCSVGTTSSRVAVNEPKPEVTLSTSARAA